MARRLRIVSVVRSLPNVDDPSGGIFVLNRLAEMAEVADVTVVQPVPYLPGVKSLPRWARSKSRRLAGLEILHAPMLYVPGVLKSADGMWLARAIGPLVTELHRGTPLDAIDAHFGYPEGAGCAAVAQRLGVPLFITIRGFENEYVSRPLVGRRMLRAIRSATGCIAVSHSLEALATRHGVAPERVRVIHNAIDGSLFRFGDAQAARAAIEVEGAPLVVTVGHLISRKRHHVLIDAFAELKRAYPTAVLAVIGARSFEPTYPDKLLRQCRDLNLSADVRFLGNMPPRDVASWLQAADVFALATAREGCCNAVLEALGVGAPVVTTPAGDNAYFVRDNENGFIVPIDDAGSLSKAMVRVLEGTWDRRTISRELQGRVGTWTGVADRVIEFMVERLDADATRRSSAAAPAC
jgi:teichuronic acid biosynthesis glycosyltransferase TuaC